MGKSTISMAIFHCYIGYNSCSTGGFTVELRPQGQLGIQREYQPLPGRRWGLPVDHGMHINHGWWCPPNVI